VHYGFGALDVHRDRLRLRLMRRRRGQDTLAFMRQIRLCYPRHIRLYWIQENLSANWTPDIRRFAADNNIEFVPLPAHASYLNRIEATFRPITEFVVNNADCLDWDGFAHALANHVHHRNGPDRDRRIAERERKLMIAA
jgi:hypothetical protein